MQERKGRRLLRGRTAAIPLAFVLAILAILGLAVLVSAEPQQAGVAKSVTPSSAQPDTEVEYTAILTNTGTSALDIQIISDTLPSGLSYVGMVAGSDVISDPVGTTGTIVWTLTPPRSVPVGGTLRLVYQVHVGAGLDPGWYDNLITFGPSSGAPVSGTATLTILGASLTGRKTASAGEVKIGEPVDYTIVITNSGTLTGSVTSIVDTMPAGFDLVAMLIGPPPAEQGSKLTWSSLEVAPQETLQLKYRATTAGTADAQVKNSAVVSGPSGALFTLQSTITLRERVFYLHLPMLLQPEPPPPPTDRLAFERKLTDNMEIFAINTDGTGALNLSNLAGGDTSAQWSPDGSKIAWVHFINNVGDIVVASADGSSQANLTNSAKEDRGPVWSPDGTRLAFYSRRLDDRWEVYTMSPTGTDITRLTDESCGPNGQSHDPVWSPNGNKIAYLCGLDSYAEVWVMNADGTGETRLTTDDTGSYNEDASLAWSPDSTRLAHVKYYRSDHTKGDIFVVDVTTKAVTRITEKTTASYGPQWSPDGSKIAFSTHVDDSYEIVTVKYDGTNLVNLTKAAKYDKQPQWSPDGTQIAFFSNRASSDTSIFYLYVMNANGSGQTRVTSSTVNEQNADWRPQLSE